MSDEIIPAPAPPAPAPIPEAGVSNADFARLRTQADAHKVTAEAEKKRADELQAKLAQIESANLSEVERLRKENADLAPIRDEHGKFASTLERLYTAELADVPDDKRDAVAGLSGSGDWASRLESLRNAKALIVTAPVPAGTVAAPARGSGAGTPDARPNPQTLSWGDAIRLAQK